MFCTWLELSKKVYRRDGRAADNIAWSNIERRKNDDGPKGEGQDARNNALGARLKVLYIVRIK